MPCFHPMLAYRSRVVSADGSRPIVFNPSDGYSDMRVELPCGICIGCRLEYARQWAMRCMHEEKMHEESCYLTLTYNDEHLPQDGNLRKTDIQKFLKRLRKKIAPVKIRYMQCGEYGDLLGRPHHHMILYGYSFRDARFWKSNGKGQNLYVSELLDSIWQMGYCTIGDVTFESASYVARYVTKKQIGDNIDPDKIQPYITMSRRPGIGMTFFAKYHDEIYETDSVIVRGREMKPPKAYDDAYAQINPQKMKEVKICRRKKSEENLVSGIRLSEIEKCRKIKQNRMKRDYEKKDIRNPRHKS